MARKNGNGAAVKSEQRLTMEDLRVLEEAEELAERGIKEAPAKKSGTISIPAIRKGELTLKIKGQTDLIVHAFGQKTLRQMLEAQQADKVKGPKKRKKRDPGAEFVGAFYTLPGKDVPKSYLKAKPWQSFPYKKGVFGVPAAGIKQAMINTAGRFLDAKKTELRGAFYIVGVDGSDLVPIEYKSVEMRMDPVRLAGPSRAADIRFRPGFKDWSVVVNMVFDPDNITKEDLTQLLDRAGFHIGLGDWRQEKNGPFGRFRIA